MGIMKTEEQVREMVSNGLDILDARHHQSLLWVTPWTECQLNILGEWKTNGHSIEIMQDYYYLTDRRKENFRKRHGFRPMDESFKVKSK
ncbi:hypothetical protein N9998_00395 [Nitrosopumilus sp.]|nr:hypothetical protein [Nitrosopumilus sp.]|tara:strand:- start:588 stop:854 length:267 start_codon:yes stop_codon:yes gene_type:complete